MSVRIHLMSSFVALLIAVFLVGCEDVDAATIVDSERSRALPMDSAAWSSPQLLENSNSPLAGEPQVAVDSFGNALAVWRQDSLDDSIDIWAARFTPSSGWGSAELISIISVGNKPHVSGDLQIAMAPSGRALVVWRAQGEFREVVWANEFAPKKGWGTAQTIGADTMGDAGHPRIAIDSRGNGMAVWAQDDSDDVSISDRSIWFNRFTSRNGWGNAEKVETEAAEYRNPVIAMGPSGNALVLWHNIYSSFGDANIMASRYLQGRGWGASELIEMDEYGPLLDVSLEIDDSGNAIAVWELYDYNYYDVWASRFTPADGWNEAERIETFDSGDAGQSRIAVALNGNAVAMWTQSGEIWKNHFSPGKGWSGPALFEENSGSPEITFDSEGNALAVWFGSGSIWARRFVVASGWGTAEAVQYDYSGRASDLRLVVDPFGKALVVWEQTDDDGINSLWASRFE